MNQTNIYQKLQLIQSQLKGLVKLQENKFQKYKYVGEYDLLTTVKPLLEQTKLILLFSDEDNFVKERLEKGWMVYYKKLATLINSESPNEQLTYHFWACGENQDLAKAKGSAETYAIKYFLLKFFLIPTTDNLDPDSK